MSLLRRRAQFHQFPTLISRASFEALEARQLLSAAVWTGAGTDALFSDPANWQGDVAPVSGQDISFPAGATNTNVTVDSNVAVGNVEFDASYTLASPSGSTTSITLGGNLLATVGDIVINNPIVLAQTSNFTVYALAGLTTNAPISDGGNGFGVIIGGNGPLTMLGAGETYTGTTEVQGNLITANTSFDSLVDVYPTSSFAGSGSVARLEGGHATFSLVNGSSAGSITIANGLALDPDTGNTMNFEIGGPVTGASSALTVQAGPVTLDDAILSATIIGGYEPHTGDVITLIHNNTGNAVTGTFDNLPEGASTTIGGEVYTVSYVGGSSGRDVTLTAAKSVTAIALSASPAQIYQGHSATFTATVTGHDGSGDAITGTVTFYANGTAIGSAQPVANGMASVSDAGLLAGENSITAIYSGDTNYTAATTSSPLAINVGINASGTIPTITSATTFASTHGYTIAASVAGADTSSAGAAGLSYTWTVIHTPSGAKNPTYNANGTNAARNVIVRFSKDGGYVLQCTVKNAAGNSVSTNVSVTVSQKASALKIEPHKARIAKGGTLQYIATVLDQFSHAMRTAQTFTYAVTAGEGEISSTGLFTAADVASGITIEVESANLTGTVGALVS